MVVGLVVGSESLIYAVSLIQDYAFLLPGDPLAGGLGDGCPGNPGVPGGLLGPFGS